MRDTLVEDDVIEALEAIAEGADGDRRHGICFALRGLLAKKTYGAYVDAYELIAAASDDYYIFFQLDSGNLSGVHNSGLKWDGDNCKLREMFCGMLASRIKRDGLEFYHNHPSRPR